MELRRLNILFFLISIHIIFNEQIPINNFQKVYFYSGLTEYIYQYSEPTLSEEKDAYFFFKFSEKSGSSLRIKDEDGINSEVKIDSDSQFIFYKITNLKSKIYIFILGNNGMSSSKTMFFIDNSHDINIKLSDLFNFSFETDIIEDKPPLPLIFNLEFEDNAILYYKSYSSGYIYDGNFLLENCEINEEICNYKGNKTYLTLRKEKNIK